MTNTDTPLRICILTSQYFGWGKIGGFGRMARSLAEALAERGHEASVVVPRRGDQGPHERVDGVDVLGFRGLSLREARRLIRTSTAEIFHSQDPTVLTALAQWLRPDAVHIVTCRDPRDTKDWFIEFRDASWGRRLKIPMNWTIEASPIVARAVHNADGVYTPAHFLQDKVQRMFRPKAPVGLLPNLIEVPEETPRKPATPVLTWIGRLDRRKRPERFLELASKFPAYRFVVVGRAESRARDSELRERYGSQPNVDWTGYVDRFAEPERMRGILAETWVLVNTASREGLPLTFLEAAGYGCAIVSAVNPDEFATRFGMHVTDDDFAGALTAFFREPEAVRKAGAKARSYVREVYEASRATEVHIETYKALLDKRRHDEATGGS